ncbi:MAG TPA: ShlB/FhaC/HecB family hemolysin secretion/activation protein [Burkholderiales bacterium]
MQPPDAGSIQEQLRPPEPPRPRPAPSIRIEPPRAPARRDTAPFFVSRFTISGATAFGEAQLLALVGEPRREMTLGEVQKLAERITEHYRDHGYIVARALIPAQEVRDGVVRIQVLEGRYGLVQVANATEISESRVRATLGSVEEGALVHGPTLERAMLLIADWAGVQPRATLEPGEQPGLTNLLIEIAPGRAAEYDLTLDNGGSRFTGRGRLSAGAAWSSPRRAGDRLALRAITSGEDLISARIAYETPLGAQGMRGFGYLSHTTYELGDQFASLDASGTAQAIGGGLSYPFVRSSRWNLRVFTAVEARELEDRLDALDTVTDKSAFVAQWGAAADLRDKLLGGGASAAQLVLTYGGLDIHTADARATDATTARTQGGYGKLAYSFSRLQSFGESLRGSLLFSGQRAFDNLDSSEKLSVGGINAVRAYPPGEGAGDDVQLLQAELRYDAGSAFGGQVTPLVFLDWAHSRINHRTWSGFTGDSERRLWGYGFGAEWMMPGRVFARGWYARKGGDEPAAADRDRDDRLWVQAGVLF